MAHICLLLASYQTFIFHQSMSRSRCNFSGNHHVNCMQALISHYRLCSCTVCLMWPCMIAGVQLQLRRFSHADYVHKLKCSYSLLNTSGMRMTAVCSCLGHQLQACPHVTQQLSSEQQRMCVSAHVLHAGGIWSMHCHGRSIATASKDCSVVVSSLDAAGSITAVQSYEQLHAGAVKCVRWRDNHILAACGNNM